MREIRTLRCCGHQGIINSGRDPHILIDTATQEGDFKNMVDLVIPNRVDI